MNSQSGGAGGPGRGLTTALARMDEWAAATTAAAAVVRATGVVARHGEVAEQVRIASVTKPIVAVATLIAVEDGSVDLDQPAGPPGATIRHLLAHTSGLPFDGDTPVAPPGSRRVYSNTGFDLLGEAVSAAVGLPLDQFLDEAVFAPLRMDDSVLRGSPAKDVWSTVDDLSRFAAELLRPSLLAGETYARMTTTAFPGVRGVLPGVGSFDPNDWGLGVEIRDGKSPHWTGRNNSPRTYGHFGGSGTFLWVDPDVPAALVCLTDREFGPWALDAWPALSDAVLASLGA